jgi:short-subunit dehydrogenase
MPIVVITGASSGLGEAMAVQLAQTGEYHVVLIARREEQLKRVAARCTSNADTIVGDMSKRADVDKAVAEILAKHNTIDVWVNNVGRGCFVMPSALTDEHVADMMQVNVMSAIYCMQAVLPTFKKAGGGLFVNVSSILGRMPHLASFRSAYSASKHFLNGITGSFAAEHAADNPNIVFSIASPGIIGTDFGLTAGGEDSRTMPGAQDVESCAAAIIDGAIRKRQREVYTMPAHKEWMRKHLDSLVPQ